MKDENIEKLIGFIIVGVVIVMFFLVMYFLLEPNPKKEEPRINSSFGNQRFDISNECQDWEKEIEYYCDDINNNGLDIGDCIRNSCYAKGKLSEGEKG